MFESNYARKIMNNKAIIDLDNPDFDSNEYFLHLLKNNSLKQLVDKNLNIQSEIKSFDHDIQSMVSDNYSKFISSIDIVKRMKESIEGVELKMERLEESVNKINDLAQKVDNTLEIKRTEIKKLDLINRDLSGLKKLCEFPDVLKRELRNYKTQLVTVLKDSKDKKQSPLDFPKELLKKLDLANLFKESSSYYLDCWEKLQKFKSENLIKPIYEEAISYISEIRDILYSLVFNKQMEGEEHRQILFHLLSFEDDRSTNLTAFYRNLKDKYVAKIRRLFYDVDKLSKSISKKEYEVKIDEDRSLAITIENIIPEIIHLMVQMNANNADFSIAQKYLEIRKRLEELVRADFVDADIFEQVDDIVLMFRSDLYFVTNTLHTLFSGDNSKILEDRFSKLLRSIFEDIWWRLGGMLAPYMVHTIVFARLAEGLQNITEIASISKYWKIFNCLNTRGQLEIIWILQLASLRETVVAFTLAKSKTAPIFERTKKALLESTSSNYNIFELNFEREISHHAKAVSQSLLLSSINYVSQVMNVAERNYTFWEPIIPTLYTNYWKMATEILINEGNTQDEGTYITPIKEIALKVQAINPEERVPKSKLLYSIRNKALSGYITDLQSLRMQKGCIFNIMLVNTLFTELGGAAFAGPLCETYGNSEIQFSEIFNKISHEYNAESRGIILMYASELSKLISADLMNYIKNAKPKFSKKVTEVSKGIETLIADIKIVFAFIELLFSEDLEAHTAKKEPVFMIQDSYNTNILLAKQSKILEKMNSNTTNTQRYVNISFKAIMRVLLRIVRSTYFMQNEAKQVSVDIAFLSDILNDYVSKDDALILSGFYQETLLSLDGRVTSGANAGTRANTSELENMCKAKRDAVSFINV